MIKSLFLRARSCTSGTLEPGSAGTPAVVVSPPFSGSGVVVAGFESEGSSGGFSLDGGVEIGGAAPWEFATGAEASTLAVAVAVAPLSGCFSCSAGLPWSVGGNRTARKARGESIQYHRIQRDLCANDWRELRYFSGWVRATKHEPFAPGRSWASLG
jgi:hypothetical protein